MYKSDLTHTQLKDLGLFNLILECDGWADTEEHEKRLDLGENVKPEGMRVTSNGQAMLEAQFHAPLNMISLRITDVNKADKILFHFMYDNHPERILEWLVDQRPQLCLETYPEAFMGLDGKCEMILLEIAHDEIYEVKPPKSAL